MLGGNTTSLATAAGAFAGAVATGAFTIAGLGAAGVFAGAAFVAVGGTAAGASGSIGELKPSPMKIPIATDAMAIPRTLAVLTARPPSAPRRGA